MAQATKNNNRSRAIFNWMHHTHITPHYTIAHWKHFSGLIQKWNTISGVNLYSNDFVFADKTRRQFSKRNISTQPSQHLLTDTWRSAVHYIRARRVLAELWARHHYAAALSSACQRSGHCWEAERAACCSNNCPATVTLGGGHTRSSIVLHDAYMQFKWTARLQPQNVTGKIQNLRRLYRICDVYLLD